MRFLVYVSTVLLTFPALAHEGHGGGSPALHDMQHMLYTLAAVGLVATALLIYRKLFRRKPPRNKHFRDS